MNQRLTRALAHDDEQTAAGMPPDERITCPLHRAFREDCLHEHRPDLGPVLFYRLTKERRP